MNLTHAQQVWDDFRQEKQPLVADTAASKCEECGVVLVKTGAGFKACPMCGACDCLETDLVCHETWVKKQSMYKRRLYCQEKLRMLVGLKQSTSPRYKTLVKRMKKLNVKSLVIMKQYLKEWGERNMYKYIYSMYTDVTGKKLITLSSQQIDKISIEFVIMESKFKQNKGKRKNFFNYLSMIYLLMRKHKLKGHSHILLPLNFFEIRRHMKLLL